MDGWQEDAGAGMRDRRTAHSLVEKLEAVAAGRGLAGVLKTQARS